MVRFTASLALISVLVVSIGNAQVRRPVRQPAPQPAAQPSVPAADPAPTPPTPPTPPVSKPAEQPPELKAVLAPIPTAPPPAPLEPPNFPDDEQTEETSPETIIEGVEKSSLQKPVTVPGVDPRAVASTEDIPPDACTIVMCSSNLSQIIILNGAGLAIPEAKSLEISMNKIGEAPTVRCKFYAGVFEPTDAEVVQWTLHQIMFVDKDAFQKMIDLIDSERRRGQ